MLHMVQIIGMLGIIFVVGQLAVGFMLLSVRSVNVLVETGLCSDLDDAGGRALVLNWLALLWRVEIRIFGYLTLFDSVKTFLIFYNKSNFRNN